MNQLRNLLQRVSLFAIVLGLLSTGILGAADGKAKAKTYSINVSNPIKVGTVTLKPGDYKVKLEGTEATFLRVASNETFKVPAKIESGTDKYPKTALIQNTEGGQPKLVGLGLKGTTDVMKFE
jgi:hypothetical protein